MHIFTFNRTKLECKLVLLAVSKSVVRSFNRTKLECKFPAFPTLCIIALASFNRTKLECKSNQVPPGTQEGGDF